MGKTIHQKLNDAGVELYFHESDLYAVVNETSKAILKDYEFKKNVKVFRGNDGRGYYDIPFGNDAFWKNKRGLQKAAQKLRGFRTCKQENKL